MTPNNDKRAWGLTDEERGWNVSSEGAEWTLLALRLDSQIAELLGRVEELEGALRELVDTVIDYHDEGCVGKDYGEPPCPEIGARESWCPYCVASFIKSQETQTPEIGEGGENERD